MKRWGPYAIALLALAVSVVSLARTLRSRVPELPPAPVHHFAAAEPASPSFYANMRATGRYYVTDPICAGGAVGDDSHDDTAAIASCNTQAQAVNGTVFFPTPSVAYKTTSELAVNWPAQWVCDSPTYAACVIRAHAAMRSVLAIRSTFGGPGNEGALDIAAKFENLTIDANQLAHYGRINLGAEHSVFKSIRTLNAIDACIYDALVQVAPSLSAVTPTVPGGSPTGVTVTNPDPNYNTVSNTGVGTYTVRARIVGGGALNTATLQLSFDGGATYQAETQPVSATTNLVHTSGGNAQNLTGFQLLFPPGPYFANDYYTFTVTQGAGDYAQAIAGNANLTYDNPIESNCGLVEVTTGMQAAHPALGGYQHATAAGTIATTAGSQILRGTGTQFTSYPHSASWRTGLWVNTGGAGSIYQAIILSDTIAAVLQGTEPTATASGLDFAFGIGGGYFETGSVEGRHSIWYGGQSAGSAVCYSFSGGQGPIMIGPELFSCAIAGFSFGADKLNVTNESQLIRPKCDSNSGPAPYYFSPNSTGSISEPQVNLFFSGSGVGWEMCQAGFCAPIGAYGTSEILNVYSQSLRTSTVSLTTAGQTIPLPDATFLRPGNITGLIYLTTSAQFTLSGNPTIATAPTDGVLVELMNNGAFPITFQTDQFQSTGLNLEAQFVTLGYRERIVFISHNGKWVQRGPVSRFFTNGLSGNSGKGTRVFKTTTNTATIIWPLDVLNGGISAGTTAIFTVKAQARSGTDVAIWSDCDLYDDAQGNRLGYACSHYVSTAGNAATWTMSPVLASPFDNVTFTGDNSGNAVFVEIEMNASSPPVSF